MRDVSLDRGYTMVEIFITLAIIAIVTAIGITTMSEREAASRISQAATDLATDLSMACSLAPSKGCPMRIVFCMDKACSTLATGTASDGKKVGSGSDYARVYAMIRMTTPCATSAGTTTDGFANWDFDSKPRELPRGVAISAIYSDASKSLNAQNWTSSVSNAVDADASMWFSPSLIPSYGNIPVSLTPKTATNSFIAFQVSPDNCIPATDESCMGYFIGISSGCQTEARRCFAGSRPGTAGASSDICINN